VRPNSTAQDVFILSAFDRDQWCPVLQARFRVEDLEALRSILGEQASDDLALRHRYLLDNDELAAVTERFAVAFDPTELHYQPPDIFLFRPHKISEAPYLIHTGYELPLLLDGRKKLARMSHEYPPETFEGEDRFDYWVSAGIFSKAEFSEPFDQPIKGWLGYRTVYYTPLGEEWRVPAMRMLSNASGRSGGWNEHFERLEGILFGYSDAENDWWINVGLQGGGFGGASICCAISPEGLAWIEATGFRALPPSNKPTVKMSPYCRDTENELRDLLFDDPGVAALVRFNVLGRHIMSIVDLRRPGPWEVPSAQISQLNRHIRGSVVVVAHRDYPPTPNDAAGA
jgi:hypothetical protein